MACFVNFVLTNTQAMNKILIIMFLMLASVCSAQSQNKYLFAITFTDKGAVKKVNRPDDYLSAKAIDRRIKHSIAFDETDLPVNAGYINTVLNSGAKLLTSSRWLNCIVIESDSGSGEQLAQLPFVYSVKIIQTAAKHGTQSRDKFHDEDIQHIPDNALFLKNDADNKYDYGAAANQISQIKGQYLHNLNYCGQGMTIAVLDNGFNRVDVMDAFDSLFINNQVLGTKDFVTPGANVYDPLAGSHGTHVLSTMASNIPGVIVGTAPKANYWLIHTEDNAGEAVIEEYYWVSGAEFADSVGADIINSSLGYTVFLNSPEYNHTYADMDGNTCISSIGADIAAKKGILVVNSAGNSGSTGDTWQYIGAPADGDSVFSIGAVDAYGKRSSFSSKGPTFDGQIKPDIAAQGTGTAIYTWNNGTQSGSVSYGNGTSFSSPIIAGMSACLWQSAPDKSNMDIISSLRSTASNAQSPDTLIGWGIPDYELAHSTLTAGIGDLQSDRILKIYPNPFTDSFMLELPVMLKGDLNIEIIAIDGKVVYSEKLLNNLPSTVFSIHGLSVLKPGFYILKVNTENGVYATSCLKR